MPIFYLSASKGRGRGLAGLLLCGRGGGRAWRINWGSVVVGRLDDDGSGGGGGEAGLVGGDVGDGVGCSTGVLVVVGGWERRNGRGSPSFRV